MAPELSGWFLDGAGLPPPVNPAVGVPFPTDLAQLREQVARVRHGILERAQARVPEGVKANTVLLEGRVGEAIIERIRAAGHDLVAMGSRGVASCARWCWAASATRSFTSLPSRC